MFRYLSRSRRISSDVKNIKNVLLSIPSSSTATTTTTTTTSTFSSIPRASNHNQQRLLLPPSLVVTSKGDQFNSKNAKTKLLLSDIHARDAQLLEHDNDKFTGVSATLIQRDKFVILRTNRFSAIVGNECVHLFESESASAKAVATRLSKILCSDDIDGNVNNNNNGNNNNNNNNIVNFPSIVAEVCLDEASTALEAKLRRLGLLVDAVTKPLRNQETTDFEGNVGQFQRLLPLKQALDEIDTDIREQYQMLDEALRADFSFVGKFNKQKILDEKLREDLSFTGDYAETSGGDSLDDHEEDNDDVLQLLTSHAGRARAMGGRVVELKNALRATREVWELQLDVDRNRVVRLNLRATILGMSCAAASLPAAAMGMNVPHGLEEASIGITGAFSLISIGCIGIGASLWTAFTRKSRSTFIPTLFGGGKHEKNVRELRALRYVLVNLDNLDDALRDDIHLVVNSKGFTNRDRVKLEIEKVGGTADAESVDLVFEVFDRNRDGKITINEWEGKSS